MISYWIIFRSILTMLFITLTLMIASDIIVYGKRAS